MKTFSTRYSGSTFECEGFFCGLNPSQPLGPAFAPITFHHKVNGVTIRRERSRCLNFEKHLLATSSGPAARRLGVRPVDVSRLILSGTLREIQMPVVRRRITKRRMLTPCSRPASKVEKQMPRPRKVTSTLVIMRVFQGRSQNSGIPSRLFRLLSFFSANPQGV